MGSFTRETVVDAPLARVWAFHATIDGLRALTPGWLALRIESVERPPDAVETAALPAGTEIHASVAPFHVLPRQTWTSIVESRWESRAECGFVDTMRDGPLPHWRHTHRFVRDGDRTRVVDDVEFDAPGGWIGVVAVRVGLAVFFAYRHRRTRGVLRET